MPRPDRPRRPPPGSTASRRNSTDSLPPRAPTCLSPPRPQPGARAGSRDACSSPRSGRVWTGRASRSPAAPDPHWRPLIGPGGPSAVPLHGPAEASTGSSGLFGPSSCRCSGGCATAAAWCSLRSVRHVAACCRRCGRSVAASSVRSGQVAPPQPAVSERRRRGCRQQADERASERSPPPVVSQRTAGRSPPGSPRAVTPRPALSLAHLAASKGGRSRPRGARRRSPSRPPGGSRSSRRARSGLLGRPSGGGYAHRSAPPSTPVGRPYATQHARPGEPLSPWSPRCGPPSDVASELSGTW